MHEFVFFCLDPWVHLMGTRPKRLSFGGSQ
jgi:hypothetical protein